MLFKRSIFVPFPEQLPKGSASWSPGEYFMISRSWWDALGGLSRQFRSTVLPVWYSAADTHLRLLDSAVCPTSFLDGVVLECYFTYCVDTVNTKNIRTPAFFFIFSISFKNWTIIWALVNRTLKYICKEIWNEICRKNDICLKEVTKLFVHTRKEHRSKRLEGPPNV